MDATDQANKMVSDTKALAARIEAALEKLHRFYGLEMNLDSEKPSLLGRVFQKAHSAPRVSASDLVVLSRPRGPILYTTVNIGVGRSDSQTPSLLNMAFLFTPAEDLEALQQIIPVSSDDLKNFSQVKGSFAADDMAEGVVAAALAKQIAAAYSTEMKSRLSWDGVTMCKNTDRIADMEALAASLIADPRLTPQSYFAANASSSNAEQDDQDAAPTPPPAP